MEEYSGEPIAIVDQTRKSAVPYSRNRPAGQCRHIGDYVVETKRDCST